MNINYIVNEEKKTVVCILEVEYLLGSWESLRFTGKAKCSPDDQWDVETGRKIAYSRAYIKMKKRIIRMKHKWLHDLRNKQVAFEKKIAFLERSIERNEEEIGSKLTQIDNLAQ